MDSMKTPDGLLPESCGRSVDSCRSPGGVLQDAWLSDTDSYHFCLATYLRLTLAALWVLFYSSVVSFFKLGQSLRPNGQAHPTAGMLIKLSSVGWIWAFGGEDWLVNLSKITVYIKNN